MRPRVNSFDGGNPRVDAPAMEADEHGPQHSCPPQSEAPSSSLTPKPSADSPLLAEEMPSLPKAFDNIARLTSKSNSDSGSSTPQPEPLSISTQRDWLDGVMAEISPLGGSLGESSTSPTWPKQHEDEVQRLATEAEPEGVDEMARSSRGHPDFTASQAANDCDVTASQAASDPDAAACHADTRADSDPDIEGSHTDSDSDVAPSRADSQPDDAASHTDSHTDSHSDGHSDGHTGGRVVMPSNHASSNHAAATGESAPPCLDLSVDVRAGEYARLIFRRVHHHRCGVHWKEYDVRAPPTVNGQPVRRLFYCDDSHGIVKDNSRSARGARTHSAPLACARALVCR